MLEHLKNIMFIFPVMGYYLLESVILAFFITIVWNFILEPTVQIHVSYLQWVAIIWIVKVILFDVFRLISGLNKMTDPYTEK